MNCWKHLKRTILGLSLVTVMGIATTPPAAAQGAADAAGFAEMNLHDYLHRDIVLFAQGLNLDEGQRIIVESFYEDYRHAFDTGWQKTQQRFVDMRDDLQNADQDRVMAMVLAPFEEWQVEKQRIKEAFEDNVKLILNAQQREQWPAFQRQMLREKTLHRGRLSGESLNLFHVLRDLRLDNRTQRSIDSMVEQYDMELYEALQRRNQALNEAQEAMFRSIRSQDQSVNMSRVDRQIQSRVQLRDVNDKYIEYIANSLPGELSSEFRASALERAYPRVFRPLPAQRVFDEALKIEGLEDSVISAIEDLRASMLSEFQDLNQRLHQGVRDHEPRAMRNQAEVMAARQSGDDINRLNDPNIADYRQRDERAQYYMDRLRELIGHEAFAGLPGSSRYIAQRRAEPAPMTPAERERARREMSEREGTTRRSPPTRGGGGDGINSIRDQ